MCGIAGWIDFDGPQDPSILPPMLRSLRHRGPDGEGQDLLQTLGREVAGEMGQCRLAIIDLSPGGRQPMFNEDRSLQLTYNGELYNYRALRAKLVAAGHRFRSHSDSEVLLHLYEETPKTFFDELDGMFAFALWDARREELLLARDRLGIKPLYYARRGARLAFASELKALLTVPWIDTRVNARAIDAYLTYLYVPPPLTMWEGICKLPPAYGLRFSRGGLDVFRHWKVPDVEPDRRSESAILTDLWDLWEDVVRTEMVADVPVGVFLSGGLDSGALIPAASREGSIQTFTIGFNEAEYDEMRFARQVATRYATRHIEKVVNTGDLELLERLATIFDEPMADSGALANYRLAEVASQHVKVALSGAGGDEVLGGYHHHAADVLACRLDVIPRSARKVLASAARALPLRQGKRSRLRQVKRFASVLDQSPEYRHFRYLTINHFDPQLRRELLAADLCGSGNEDPFAFTAAAFAAATGDDFVNRALEVDRSTYLPNDILTLADRTSMAHGLEVRVPYLNRKFVAFTAAIPSQMKVTAGETKRLWRRALAGRLPDVILQRPKQGFGVPVDHWFRGKHGVALEQVAVGSPYFRAETVRRLFAEHRSGRADHGLRLWTIVLFEKWRAIYGA